MSSDPESQQQHVCDCCEKSVARIHWMEWDNDLSWLCDECCEQAAEADE